MDDNTITMLFLKQDSYSCAPDYCNSNPMDSESVDDKAASALQNSQV